MKIVHFLFIIIALLSVLSINAANSIPESKNIPIDELIVLGHQFPNMEYFDIAYSNIEMVKNISIENIIMKCMNDSDTQELYQILHNYKTLLDKKDSFSSLNDSATNVDSTHHYQQKIDAFRNHIFETSPKYTLFLLAQHPVNLREIQRTHLHDREALLNFWVDENHTFVFLVKQDTFHVITCQIGRKELFEKTTKLILPLYNIKNPLELEFDLLLANELYRKLFLPIEPFLNDIKSIVIIPDELLVGFPFGCLLVDPAVEKSEGENEILYHEFEDVTFLIHRYALAYNFSSLALNPVFQELRAQNKLGRKLLTMTDIVGLHSADTESQLNWSYQSPPSGKDEVEHISRILWRHENISDKNATLDYFKNNSDRFRWIYLAIPALLNNLNPEKSALLFSGEDSTTYARLKIADAMNSKLKTDMLTLTGCQLKPVDVQYKPGVIGIPQSFLMAGAQSVLFNLWRVHDRSIIYFMSKFYFELKYKRQTNSLALQRAKIASLQDTFFSNGHKISRSHPYFWAPYVLIGNANIRPPTFSTIPPNVVIAIIYFAVIILSLIIVRKTLKRGD